VADLVNPIFVTSDLEGRLLGYIRRENQLSMKVIAQGIITAVDDLIQNEGGGEWEGLSDATIARHPRRKGGSLLQDTGLLANVQATGFGADWVEVESPAPYSFYHVEGTRHMPARNFLDIDLGLVLEQTADEIGQEISKG